MLKKIRQEKGFTQDELAKLSGLDRTTIAWFEIGKRMPSLRTLKKLAKALNVEVSDLIEENSDDD